RPTAGQEQVDDWYHCVCRDDHRLARRIEPQQQFFFVVTGRLDERMAELPHKQCREASRDGGGEIREDQDIAVDKDAGTQKVKELIERMTVGRHMIVMLAPHDLDVKRS